MIDANAMAAAASGDGTATYGWAFAGVAWSTFGAEGVSQVADKGGAATSADRMSAGFSVATLGVGKVVSGGAAIAGQVAQRVASSIKASPLLVREAQAAGQSVQRSLDALVGQLAKGNMNPGSGTKHLFSGVFEARAKDGARVYFRKISDGIEVLAKSSKANQDKVIKTLKELYGD